MRFKAEFNMDNAAFENDPNGVVVDILADIAHKLTDHTTDGGAIIDPNGSKIGEWSIEEKEIDEVMFYHY